MTHTKEKIQAARDDLTPLTAYCPDHFDESTGCQVDCAMFIRDHIETLRTLLDEAISKMETVEQASGVDDNGMPHEIFANAFGDWMHHPKKDSDPIGFRTTRYTRAEPAQTVDVETLIREIDQHPNLTYVGYEVEQVIRYITTHYTLTKWEG